jgi:photosystem II stability/assembly factor-like uncharacterized protein
MKNKIVAPAAIIFFLAAGCNPFSAPTVAGIVKTVNGGADWQFFNKVKDNPKVTMSVLSISKLDFSPQSREVVFASSYTEGLFRSDDSGASWTKILSKISIYDFAISPLDPKTIYAAGIFSDSGKVVKTTDGGASWAEVYKEGTAANAVRSISLNPLSPNQLIIGTTSGNVIKSADGGLSWQLVKNFNDRVNRVLWQGGNIYALLAAKGLSKSADLGASFTDITASLNKTVGFGSLSYTSKSISNYSQVYVDGLTPSLIYLTTDQGLFKTTDEGVTWNKVNLPVKSDSVPAKAIAVARSSSNIVFTSIGSTIYKSTDGGVSWQTQGIQTDGFVNYILIDPQLPKIAYGGIYAAQ